jgi:predicted nucleic acid-binding protein
VVAETFATLTGFYKLPTGAATELTLSLRDSVMVEALTLADYERAIREARSRGVMGGGIYDSLHATFARRKKAARIVTRNPSHFQHVAPDIEILTPY